MAGASSSRAIGEGIATVNGPWCEELCDASLKSLQCGQWTIVKEEIFCAGHLDHGQVGSKLTVGSNQKVLQMLGSSIGCHGFLCKTGRAE